jgi:hypothetical protein
MLAIPKARIDHLNAGGTDPSRAPVERAVRFTHGRHFLHVTGTDH